MGNSTHLSAREILAPVAAEMAEVEAILAQEIETADPSLQPILREASLLRGKGLRPGLVLLIAKATGTVQPDHAPLAAAVEMIHNATLIHDDVLDDATARRGHHTINVKHNNEAAVLLGDYVFTRAFVIANRLRDRATIEALAESSNVVCRGEMLQVLRRFDESLTEDDYLRIIGEKTASLYRCAAGEGARLAGADSSLAEATGAFGYAMGVAFQVIDDCLDLVGEERLMGKTLATDLEKGKYTLPVIRLLAVTDGAERDAARRLLRDPMPREEKLRRVMVELERTGAVEYAFERAAAEVARGRALLERLPASAARDSIEMLTEFVLARRK